MSSSNISHDQILANIKACTGALFQGFHSSNINDLLPNTSPSFSYHIHPATVAMPGLSRAEFLSFWESFMMPNLSNFDAEVNFESFDVEQRRSTIYVSSTADTPLGEKTWKNEAVFMSQFSDDGKSLLRVDEVLDSAFFQNFSSKIRALK